MKETAFDLAMHTKSEVVQVIGHTIVLYKKGKEPKILLP
jgi:RNA-binding protein